MTISKWEMVMLKLQWEKAPYGRRGWFVDVFGIGRYFVGAERGSREWRAMLNGKRTTFCGKLEDVQAMVQRAVDAKSVAASDKV